MKITELDPKDYQPPKKVPAAILCFKCGDRMSFDLRCGCKEVQIEQMLDREHERMADEGCPNF